MQLCFMMIQQNKKPRLKYDFTRKNLLAQRIKKAKKLIGQFKSCLHKQSYSGGDSSVNGLLCWQILVCSNKKEAEKQHCVHNFVHKNNFDDDVIFQSTDIRPSQTKVGSCERNQQCRAKKCGRISNAVILDQVR